MDPQTQPTPVTTISSPNQTQPANAQPPVQPTEPQTIAQTNIRYVGFGRLPALIIDGILLLIIALPLAIVAGSNNVFGPYLPPGEENSLINIVLWFVEIIYSVFFVTRFGATPGKMLLKMKIVDKQYVKPHFWRIVLREAIGKWISGLFFIISVLFVVFSKQRRSIHDLIADTYVIYK